MEEGIGRGEGSGMGSKMKCGRKDQEGREK